MTNSSPNATLTHIYDILRLIVLVIAALLIVVYAVRLIVSRNAKRKIISRLIITILGVLMLVWLASNLITELLFWKSSLVVIVIIFLIGLFLLLTHTRPNITNSVLLRDDRGITFLKKGTYGTSRWMTKAEARYRFRVGSIRSIKNTVYGRFRDFGSTIVAYREHSKGGNRHLMLIGSSGSGKSVSFIRTEIIQSLLRGESVVATDPSAELYTDLAGFARSVGADVKVLNLSSPTNGNGWNCVAECIDPITQALDSGRLNDFVDIYMRNTGSVGNSDSFWFAAETNLLKAVIGLCAFRRTTALKKVYEELLFLILRDNNYPIKQIDDIRKKLTPYTTVQEARALLDLYAKKIGIPSSVLDDSIREGCSALPPFTISEVYKTVLAMDNEDMIQKEFMYIPMTHPAAIAYKTYSNQEINEKIKASVRMGLLNRMQLFSDANLKGILSIDDIQLMDIGEHQTVLFIITPDKTDTLNPISSLVFSFLFKDLSEQWDKEQSQSQTKGQTNCRIPVSIIMDEFYSVGSIPSFPVFIATCRKRLLNVTIALQSIGQLYDLYGENGGNTILSCCDTLLFMGCNDLATAQFISAFCAGEATIQSHSFHTTKKSLFTFSNSREPHVGASESSRRLITPDEVRRFTDGVLVVARGEQPLRLKRFPFYEHPVCKAGMLSKSNIYDIPSVLHTSGYDNSSELSLADLPTYD